MPAGGQRVRMIAAARRRQGGGRRRRWLAAAAARPGAAAAWWRSRRPRARRITAGSAAVAVAAAAGLLTWLSLGGTPAPQARQYLSFTACLLTGPAGLADAAVKPVWAGMQDASLATRAQVEYLPSFGGSTGPGARPYLASLVQRHCRVVVAVGAAQAAAVAADAARYPAVRFVVVGGQASGRNVAVVTGPADAVRASVDSLITAAAADSA